MNKEEIDELRLLTLPRKYTYMTNEEFATIKEGFNNLQSQLTRANSKIEKIKEYVSNLDRIDSYSCWGDIDEKVQDELLSIIDGSDE